MIIFGTPRNMEDYVMADGILAMELAKRGFIAKYRDEDVLYFKKNAKLLKVLEKLDENLA